MVAVLRPEKIYIFRSSPKGNYTTVMNEVINDHRLKGGLLELMVYMLSKPPTWRINTKELSDRFDLNLDTVNKRLNELSNLGYVKRIKLRNRRGIYTEMEVYVTDKPTFLEGFNPDLEKSGLVQSGLAEPGLSNTDLSNNDLNKASLKKKQQAYIGSLITHAREELANQITVRERTMFENGTGVAAASIFKKKSLREQMAAMRRLRHLGRTS